MKKIIFCLVFSFSVAMCEALSIGDNPSLEKVFNFCSEKLDDGATIKVNPECMIEKLVKNCLDARDEKSCQGFIDFFRPSVKKCDKLTCNDIGLIFENTNDSKEAMLYFNKACDLKSAAGCFNVGIQYYNGRVVKQNYSNAAKYYKKACDLNFALACFNLGAFYINGLGVRQNLSTAKEYCGRACDLGEQKGCDCYKQMNEQSIK